MRVPIVSSVKRSAILLWTVGTLSAFAGNPMTNCAELTELVLENKTESVPFEISAVLTLIPPTNANAIVVQDDSGGANVYIRDLHIMGLTRGDYVHASGTVRRMKDGLLFAVAERLSVTGHVDMPSPVDITAGELYSGKHVYELVRITGTVVDAFRDEANLQYTFVALSSGGKTVFLPSMSLDDESLPPLIDAKVSIIGTSVCYRNVGPRAKLGYEIQIGSIDDITVLEPARADPFDVPEIQGNVADICMTDSGTPVKHRLSGRVVAVWSGGNILVRTEVDDFSTVCLARSEPPRCGTDIECVGYPETDFYGFNLTRAIWRPLPADSPRISDIPSVDDPVPVTAAFLLTDGAGRREYAVDYHGRTIRIEGTVRHLPNHEGGDGILHLQCDDFLVPVNGSAVMEAFDGLEAGCRIEVTGVCVMETESWRPHVPFPHVTGMSVILRSADDIRVLSRQPWWTPARLLIVIGSLLAAVFAFFLWNVMLRKIIDRRSRQLFKSQIAEAESELRIDERTRLAVELHDSISQNLTGVALQINAANRSVPADAGTVRHHLDLASMTLKSCRNELRNCLWDLRNDALEVPEMNEAIRRTLAPHIEDEALHVRFNVPRRRFTDNTAHTILRTVRELAVNAIRHGGATELHIAGKEECSQIRFSVRDNGRGFNPDSAPGVAEGHFGLQGVRERIKSYDGKLEIRSSPGAGCKVTITLRTTHNNEDAT